jgi:hypothetical protein
LDQVLPGSGDEGHREVAQTVYTHMSKCKIDLKSGKLLDQLIGLIASKSHKIMYSITERISKC